MGDALSDRNQGEALVIALLRDISANVGKVREDVAGLKGEQLGARLSDVEDAQAQHLRRLEALEAHRLAQEASRKPFIFVMAQVVTAFVAATVGALVAAWATGFEALVGK